MLLEGDLGDHFSYTAYTQLLSAEPSELYATTGRSDAANWLKIATMSYSLGDFTLSLGKNYMFIGTWEEDPYDHESHWDYNSIFWNYFQVYQWGGDLTYDINDSAYASLQVTGSPFTVHPFDDGLLSYTAFCTAEADDVSARISGHLVGIEPHRYMKMLAGGGLYTFGNFTIGVDSMLRQFDTGKDYETTSILSLCWAPSERFDITAKAIYEEVHGAVMPETFTQIYERMPDTYYSGNERLFGGIAAHYRPLKDTDALRLHAVVTHMPFMGGVSINIGALYNFTINL